jgi:acyl carrier protein
MSIAVRDIILRRVAELAGDRHAEIRDDASLESLGLDSSDAVILAMEVEEQTGREIDVGTFLRFETLREAIEDIETRLAA